MTAYRAPRCSWPRAPRGAGRRKTSPRTTSVGERRSELRELLSDDPHLLTVALICRQAPDFIAYRRPHPSPAGRLPQRGAHCLGVGQAVTADDLERRCRCLVESNVKRTCHTQIVARIVLRDGERARACREARAVQTPVHTAPRKIGRFAGLFESRMRLFSPPKSGRRWRVDHDDFVGVFFFLRAVAADAGKAGI